MPQRNPVDYLVNGVVITMDDSNRIQLSAEKYRPGITVSTYKSKEALT